MAALEAMACGKAIVRTNGGGLANLILLNFNGKIFYPSVTDICQAIEEYIQPEEERFLHGSNTRMVVEQAFSKNRWENNGRN